MNIINCLQDEAVAVIRSYFMTRTEPFEVDLEVGKNLSITSHFID